MNWKPADPVGQRLLRAANGGADLHSHPARLTGALEQRLAEISLKAIPQPQRKPLQHSLEKRRY